jgi:hypothetical protein
VPILENLKFNGAHHGNWKIVYKAVENPNDKKTKALLDKIQKFIKDRSMDKLWASLDIYTMDKNFVVIHGMKTEEHAKGIASILKEFKEYKIADPAYVISSNNYKVVQIRKNFDEFLTVGNQPYVPPAVTETVSPAKLSPQAPPAKGETLQQKIDRETAAREAARSATKQNPASKGNLTEPDQPTKATPSMMPPSPAQFPPTQTQPVRSQSNQQSQTAPPRK